MSYHSKTVDIAFATIGFIVHRLREKYLWCDVAQSTTLRVRIRLHFQISNNSQAKINEFRLQILRLQDNILRLDISMNDIFRMTLFEYGQDIYKQTLEFG